MPRIWTDAISVRIALTAAASAPFLSPRPTQRPPAIAAASVTRTSSSARLRSGASLSTRSCCGIAVDSVITTPLVFEVLVLVTRAGRRRGSLQPGARTVEPGLADPRQLLAASPQAQRLLQRGAAVLQLAHDLDQLVAGLLVRQRRRGSRRCLCHDSTLTGNRPPATRASSCSSTATSSGERTTPPSAFC